MSDPVLARPEFILDLHNHNKLSTSPLIIQRDFAEIGLEIYIY